VNSTRERIREAAITRFVELGFAGTGIRQLADDVGITTASLYYHINSKDDLLDEIIDSTMNALIEAAELVIAEQSRPMDRLAGLVALHVTIHATCGAETIVVDRQLGAMKPEARERAIAQRDRYERLWRKVLKTGIADGSFVGVEPRLGAQFLLGSCTAVADWYRPGGRLSPKKLASEYVALAALTVQASSPTEAPDIAQPLAVFERRYLTPV
jgi:AcrR family transcriptional regulator